MTDLIEKALSFGAKIYGSVSGGKDGQAMVRTLMQNSVPVEGLLHCDLGRAEWPQSLGHCQKQADEYGLPLHVVRRKKGGLVERIWQRVHKLEAEGRNIPAWPSADNRYCTSDTKRGPSNVFFTSTGHNLIISAEGIRAQESDARKKKDPLTIRSGGTSSYYKGMTVEQALEAYRPDKRLVLNWYPIFNFTIEEVWDTYHMSAQSLQNARVSYAHRGCVPDFWPFHPAYAMGNDRLSCALCVLGSLNDLQNGADHNPELLEEYIEIEDYTGFTFKQGFSLKELKTPLQ